jgi:choline dehydrogenase-like flavoprotein
MKKVFREAGMFAAITPSFSMPILQGTCVGGSTLINSAISWRLPEEAHHIWAKEFGLGEALPYATLESCFSTIEEELHIVPTPDNVAGKNNLLMKKGAEALGIPSCPTQRAVHECEGKGLCLQGCPNHRKQSMTITYIPMALQKGARLYSSCRVEKISVEKGAAVGVIGHFLSQDHRRKKMKLYVRARKGVILAASAIQTPLLLQRNGLANSSGRVGAHFQAHPGAAVLGFYKEEVRQWEGVTQGFQTKPSWEKRYKLESLTLPPELLMIRMPGIGTKTMAYLDSLRHTALWVAAIRSEAQGKIRDFFGIPRVSYVPTPRDMEALRNALKTLADMHFAAGAYAVAPNVLGLPDLLTSPDQTRLLLEQPSQPGQVTMAATHLFGTCRMGIDPKTSVVNPRFECHDVKRLYITDSSVFPTNIGVNPQHTIIALAMHASHNLLNR